MYESVTAEELLGNMLEPLKGKFDTQEGSVAYTILSPVAFELANYFEGLVGMEDMAFVNENSGEYIDRRAAEFGIRRKGGTKAKAILTFTGASGSEIPSGAEIEDDFGHTFIVEKGGTIGEDGTGSAVAYAEEPGAGYNAPANTIQYFVNYLDGVDSVTNEEAAEGGADQESDEALLSRLNDFRQRPATSGNAASYRQWALQVDGVGAAKILPLEKGAGTVGVLLAGYDKQPVNDKIVEAAKAHIESLRPIGATVEVRSGEAATVNVSATVTTDGGKMLTDIQGDFAVVLGRYLAELAFMGEALKMNRIGAMLLDIDGVLDYTGLQLNGGGGNLELGAGRLPVVGEVSLYGAT